jgi:hypothetical protein
MIIELVVGDDDVVWSGECPVIPPVGSEINAAGRRYGVIGQPRFVAGYGGIAPRSLSNMIIPVTELGEYPAPS